MPEQPDRTKNSPRLVSCSSPYAPARRRNDSVERTRVGLGQEGDPRRARTTRYSATALNTRANPAFRANETAPRGLSQSRSEIVAPSDPRTADDGSIPWTEARTSDVANTVIATATGIIELKLRPMVYSLLKCRNASGFTRSINWTLTCICVKRSQNVSSFAKLFQAVLAGRRRSLGRRSVAAGASRREQRGLSKATRQTKNCGGDGR